MWPESRRPSARQNRQTGSRLPSHQFHGTSWKTQDTISVLNQEAPSPQGEAPRTIRASGPTPDTCQEQKFCPYSLNAVKESADPLDRHHKLLYPRTIQRNALAGTAWIAAHIDLEEGSPKDENRRKNLTLCPRSFRAQCLIGQVTQFLDSSLSDRQVHRQWPHWQIQVQSTLVPLWPFRKAKAVKRRSKNKMISSSHSISHHREWVVDVGVDPRRTLTTLPQHVCTSLVAK